MTLRGFSPGSVGGSGWQDSGFLFQIWGQFPTVRACALSGSQRAPGSAPRKGRALPAAPTPSENRTASPSLGRPPMPAVGHVRGHAVGDRARQAGVHTHQGAFGSNDKTVCFSHLQQKEGGRKGVPASPTLPPPLPRSLEPWARGRHNKLSPPSLVLRGDSQQTRAQAAIREVGTSALRESTDQHTEQMASSLS